ncbi:MAG: hypothetical protein KKB50_05240 [Planctomycetes bacterium]|nr:hypothetical protein [Planctomycetota bacterium]
MTSQRTSLDGKTFAIGVLSITACILFVGFLLLSLTPPTAHAIGQSDRGGDYIVLTQQLTSSNEGLIILDAASKRMILYGFDYNKKAFAILDGYALDNLRKPRADLRP